MKKERTVLSLIAITIGLLFAGIAFYIYQYTKILPLAKTKTVSISAPTPTPKPSIFLLVNEPSDEKIFNKKVVTVSGKTEDNATIVIMTKSDFDVLKPSSVGNFSTTINLNDGINIIRITAIAPNGEEQTIERTVGFTTEDF
ncbi:MAG: hypothetical protein COY68_01830 [Candidatus Levybacteria bacterium CG_4_10_14_0_8_um_filter_35_23]|nr:MAG: hypothetical protein COY68_01830 [Candidatus Levybacteria bacterium CG_4_10_14_0_8_um_filter_35_23]